MGQSADIISSGSKPVSTNIQANAEDIDLVPAQLIHESVRTVAKARPVGWSLVIAYAALVSTATAVWILLLILMLGEAELASVVFVFIWIGIGLAAVVVLCIWLSTAWSALPQEEQSISPALVVALLFVPILSIYWVFVAVPGLSRRLDEALLQRFGDSHQNAGYSLGVSAAVVSVIPVLNVLVAPLLLAGWMYYVTLAFQSLQGAEE